MFPPPPDFEDVSPAARPSSPGIIHIRRPANPFWPDEDDSPTGGIASYADAQSHSASPRYPVV
jgi:hypothetical protein